MQTVTVNALRSVGRQTMKIVMFTNTFTPHIGGVANSVSWLAESLRGLGHSVLVVAPDYVDHLENEAGVVRVPAITHFWGSDFSVPIPFGHSLDEELDVFSPDIVHSHHPFLLGDTALRLAASRELPVVFTYHTRYELYGHYAVHETGESLSRLIVSLTIGYCNLCDGIIAPSRSIAQFLADHRVLPPVTVIPTGIDLKLFGGGDGRRCRSRLSIPPDAFVVGHVGRLAPEKNLGHLIQAVRSFLIAHQGAHFMVAGQGEMSEPLRAAMTEAGLSPQLHMLGSIIGGELADTYAAMDVFAFSSRSETQGLVLAEAMAAGVPVVAIDAPGAREIVADGRNGRLLPDSSSTVDFAAALAWTAQRPESRRQSLRKAARESAKGFSRSKTTEQTVMLYRTLLERGLNGSDRDPARLRAMARALRQEWRILRNMGQAIADAVPVRRSGMRSE